MKRIFPLLTCFLPFASHAVEAESKENVSLLVDSEALSKAADKDLDCINQISQGIDFSQIDQLGLVSIAQSVPQESSEVEQLLDLHPNLLSLRENISLDEISSWSTSFFLFGQLEVILPGGGFAVRTQKNSIGFEGALSIIGFLWPAIKSTVSLIKYFDDSGKGWYFGLGAGSFIALLDSGIGVGLDLPVFLGYRMSHSFWDIGVDLLPLEGSFIPLPAFRFAIGF